MKTITSAAAAVAMFFSVNTTVMADDADDANLINGTLTAIDSSTCLITDISGYVHTLVLDDRSAIEDDLVLGANVEVFVDGTYVKTIR